LATLGRIEGLKPDQRQLWWDIDSHHNPFPLKARLDKAQGVRQWLLEHDRGHRLILRPGKRLHAQEFGVASDDIEGGANFVGQT